jgi:hypothetical protein
VALALVLVVFLTGVSAAAFPTQGWYPYDLTDTAIVPSSRWSGCG